MANNDEPIMNNSNPGDFTPLGFEVDEPILNTAFAAPALHWYIREGEPPQKRTGRRPSIVYPPRIQNIQWSTDDGTLRPSKEYAPGYELVMVNLIRERLQMWRQQNYPGVTRTTLELLQYWHREGRQHRLFYAQLEAAETLIFINEARQDFKQGINVPLDEPSDQQKMDGIIAFKRYACKMATGAGKTTVMAMLAACSILNKMNDRSDARFSDVVLIVCPNVTIKNRLRELDPAAGEASIYRTRDLVPEHFVSILSQGKVLITNWHLFERQSIQVGGVPARVSKIGVPLRTTETITIGPKTTTARGTRYLTEETLRRQVHLGWLKIIEERQDKNGHLIKVKVESLRYVESDTKWIKRVLGKEFGSKQNILVMNDEAHHAYRIKKDVTDEDEYEDPEDRDFEEEMTKEATVWVEGLDRIHRLRGINFCIDLSATPFYLGRVGQETNKPFPWVVSDFGLTDAIESGLTKIPQLAVRDNTGAEIPGYFNIWHWILPKLTPAERGGKKSSPKSEAILKYANHPIAMLGGLWEDTLNEWAKNTEDSRPPVFIIVCKNTKIAKVIYEWLALNQRPSGIPPANLPGFRNTDNKINTIRVDTKVIQETDIEGAKSDETRWMRLTLDTIGKINWPTDRQGRPIYPEGFEELARKLNRPLHPPGRDVRCIVSVGMLTEGWDCNTVTHIIGLRPFMSQLLCEQVVGRGLRRTGYKPDPETGRFPEEVAKVFGVPFEVIPFKANPGGTTPPKEKRYHVHAIPEKENYRIAFPRIEGYTLAIRNRITIDWENESTIPLNPSNIPPEVQMKATLPSNTGRPTLTGPGKLEDVSLNPFRAKRRYQELVFELASTLTREYVEQSQCELPAHVLFPQLLKIVDRYLKEKTIVNPPADLMDVFLSPYFGWVIERLRHAIRPDTSQGEAPEIPKYERLRKPGSTDEVDFWTSRDVRAVVHCHLNYVVADTKHWEQSATYYIDTHPAAVAFVKNAGLGFAIPYFHNGQPHEYLPDFIIRLKSYENEPQYLILETKGYDELEGIKKAAAERWANAVNADGKHGNWQYKIARKPEDVISILNRHQ